VIGRDAVAVIDTGGSLRAGQRLLAALRQRTPQASAGIDHRHRVAPDHEADIGDGAVVAPPGQGPGGATTAPSPMSAS
jgi:hypothetical protein